MLSFLTVLKKVRFIALPAFPAFQFVVQDLNFERTLKMNKFNIYCLFYLLCIIFEGSDARHRRLSTIIYHGDGEPGWSVQDIFGVLFMIISFGLGGLALLNYMWVIGSSCYICCCAKEEDESAAEETQEPV